MKAATPAVATHRVIIMDKMHAGSVSDFVREVFIANRDIAKK
ncbi:MAG: hypothetical protein ABSA13_17465 [Beijerinckiaceae bacterium]|jgi:FixJ family two-component response regulator